MKRMIYTAVALICCASVFGIADYFNAKKQGALVNYTDEVQAEAVAPKKKTEIITTAKEEIKTSGTRKEIKKQTKAEKKVSRTKVNEPYYTSIIPSLVVTEQTKEPAADKVDPLNIVLQSKTTDADDSTIQTSGKRKINMEMFSRAPIREKKLKRK